MGGMTKGRKETEEGNTSVDTGQNQAAPSPGHLSFLIFPTLCPDNRDV